MGRHKKPLNRLKDYIRIQMIADVFPPGTRLPAITTLGKKNGLKYNAARNALRELAADGLLNHDHYAFTVNSWRKSPDGPKIAILMQYRPEMPGLYHQALLGMLDQAMLENIHFVIHPVSFRDITQEKLDSACRGMDGIILLSSYDATLPDFTLPLPGTGVMISPNRKFRFSTINIDVDQAAQLAVGYFRKRHVQNIAIYSAPRTVFTDRGKAFAEAFTRAGGSILFFRTGNEIADIDIPAKAGILCTSDFITQKLCSHYARYSGGVWLPDRHFLLSIDGNRFFSNWTEMGRRDFTTIHYDWQQAGSLALQKLLAMIADPAAEGRDFTIPGTLSTPPANHRRSS